MSAMAAMPETIADIETELDVWVLEGLDFAPRCEHAQHSDPGWRHHHGGDAAWLASGMCPGCPLHAQYLICDRWRTTLVDNPDAYLTCTQCNSHYPWRDFGFVFIPIPKERA
jgi:hypothetical protein